jgi:hypothetical protein
MNKSNKIIPIAIFFTLMNQISSAQIASPITPSIDTLYMTSGSRTPSIDPNPGTNPFLTDSTTRFGRIVANDDPGGPGSGGGFNPPADAAIPLDGGISGLVLAGALIGLKRTKKEKDLL